MAMMAAVWRPAVRNSTQQAYFLQRSIASRFSSTEARPQTSDSNVETNTSASSSENIMSLWKPGTRRVGAVGRKLGMTTLWTDQGKQMPATVIQLEDTEVISCVEQKLTVIVGCSNRPESTTKGSLLGLFKKFGLSPKYKITEFPVDSVDAFPPIGTKISAAHFVPGQCVDVQAKTIGKGFQGVMKRWGFKGMPASHGTTKKHRSGGSIGANTTPGRVFPGKKMPGRMGNKLRTTESLQVVRVDTELNLLYVRGCVPGHKETFVRIRDCLRRPPGTRRHRGTIQSLPFPAMSVEMAKKWPRHLIASIVGRDPWTTPV